MGWYCCVPFCNNRINSGYSFHGFPSNKSLRKQWLHKIRRDEGKNFRVTNCTKVCGAHFTEKDFKPLLHTKRKFLKADSVPSVFNWTNKQPSEQGPEQRSQKVTRRLPLSPIQQQEQLHSGQWENSLLTILQNPSGDENHLPGCSSLGVANQLPCGFDSEELISDQSDKVSNTCMDPTTVAANALLMLHGTTLNNQKSCQTDETVMHNVAILKLQLDSLQKTLAQQRQVILKKERQIQFLKSKEFSLNSISKSPEVFSSYTGLPNFSTFCALSEFLFKKAEKMKYWRGQLALKTSGYQTRNDIKKPGCEHLLSMEDQLFLVLFRLRRGTPVIEVARLFGIKAAHVSRIVISWMNFLYFELRSLFPIPERHVIKAAVPKQFSNYPNTTLLLDCTEIRVERPSSIQRQKETFSNYKHYNTFKCLIGITPGGLVCFVSKLFGGGYSDKYIAKESGLYDLIKAGDELMVDKGFDIEDDVPTGVRINVPPKFQKKVNIQMPVKDVETTRKIAQVRVHIERAIRRLKTFNLISSIPLSMAASADQIVTVCAYLTNFQPALIRQETPPDC